MPLPSISRIWGCSRRSAVRARERAVRCLSCAAAAARTGGPPVCQLPPCRLSFAKRPPGPCLLWPESLSLPPRSLSLSPNILLLLEPAGSPSSCSSSSSSPSLLLRPRLRIAARSAPALPPLPPSP